MVIGVARLMPAVCGRPGPAQKLDSRGRSQPRGRARWSGRAGGEGHREVKAGFCKGAMGSRSSWQVAVGVESLPAPSPQLVAAPLSQEWVWVARRVCAWEQVIGSTWYR